MPIQSSNQTLPRLLEILKHIPREPRFVDVKRICSLLAARGFSASPRLVQRDLNSLAAVFPISNRPRKGEASAWFWPKDVQGVTFPLPSAESLLSLFLVDKYLRKMVPTFMQREMSFIIPRIDSLIKMPVDKDVIEKWNKFVRFVPAHFQTESPELSKDVHEVCFNAFVSGKKVNIGYASLSCDGSEKALSLSIQGIVYKPPVLYLVASAFNYSDVRAYALHRVTSAEIIDEKIKMPDGFSIDQFIENGGLSISDGGTPTKVLLQVRGGLIRYLQEVPLSKDQTIKVSVDVDGNDNATVEATLTPTRAFKNWLMSVAAHVQIVEPSEIREEIKALLHKAVVAYD